MVDPNDDAAWNEHARAETTTQRLDRNWSGLLQELRVVQTGVQILTGFLLTLPFQSGFAALDSGMKAVYLVTVSAAMAAAILLAAPVALHRMLFRRHQLGLIVGAAHRLSYVGLVLLGIALSGATLVVFDAATSSLILAVCAGGAVAVLFTILWLVVPLALRTSIGAEVGGGEHDT
ncbi:DUF6328 family protein [Gordonia aichiensis]|uniref:Sodium:proton antiporter n=1 Tax=Gordonia aichiensis NBRC 108223 TaxID=1220583 RepID=L7KH34_9ACTN|nr:DUF6328 family protein [Gordonia aichiensis]GAC46993.1 hypothetical protein GOACH_03_00080 [Gordonia aichiensis NBRC 108223]